MTPSDFRQQGAALTAEIAGRPGRQSTPLEGHTPTGDKP